MDGRMESEAMEVEGEEGVEVVRIVPRAHQVEALDLLQEALLRGSRAQAQMCCGSGKTFTQAFLARAVVENHEDPQGVVIVCFVPNRALIHQNARNFRKVLQDEVEYLGVCSDVELAGVVDADEAEDGLETTTDPERITAFAGRTSKPRVVLCTYQSGKTLRAALGAARGVGFAVALGLFDEAHRTAGNKSTDDLFAFALDDANFPMELRAFFTATPRIIEGKKVQGLSMSNPDLYGPVAYTYPFSRGIADGNVVDYDLWVPIITRREILTYMQEHDIAGEERSAVAMIALDKVMERTGQSRFLSYHNRIAGSQAFANQLAQTLGPKGFLVAHVDGSTPGSERDRLMAALGAGRTVLTNCKAFVEGVDAPGLQGVLFVDPRKSVVDVVQAVGRLSRPDPLDPDKRGSIIAPIVTESVEPKALQKAAASAGFSTLIQVAEALRANDDALEEDILERSRAMGRGDAVVSVLRNLEVLVDDDAGVDIEALAQAITVATMQELRDTFAEQVGRLERFIDENGHMPTTDTDAKLHAWVQGVRKKHAERRLEAVHAALLDSVEGWTWIGERTKPETVAAHITAFRDRCQRMPSGKRGGGAEADLHAHLMEGQEDFLRRGLGRGGRLTLALEEANLLFFAEEVLGKRAHQSGHFTISPGVGGKPARVLFHPRTDPHRTTVPVFRSGHTVSPRPVVVHVGRTERERLLALSPNHSARITLVRAGLEHDPFEDGRILEWHGGTVDRGETPETSKGSLTWLLGRLLDRKVSGRTPYSVGALREGALRAKRAATVLNPSAPTGTVGEVVALVERVRAARLGGRLNTAQVAALDAAPGFAWLEAGDGFHALAAVVQVVVDTHGWSTLQDPLARKGDNGLANTLRVVDAMIEAWAEDTGYGLSGEGTNEGPLVAFARWARQGMPADPVVVP